MALTLKDRLARQATAETTTISDHVDREEPSLVSIPLDRIEPDPNQPRRNLGNIAELAESIRAQGLINPLVIEALAPGRYRILAGERRFAACRQLELETVPCIVRTVAEQSRLALQLVENIQRKDLHPLEEARAFRRLRSEFNLTQRDLAQRLGKSLADINQTERILDLSADVLAVVQMSEHATKSVLLEIAKEPDPEVQRALCERAISGRNTVRQVRAMRRARQSLKSRSLAWTIPAGEANIVIRFKDGEVTLERILRALDLAQTSCRSR